MPTLIFYTASYFAILLVGAFAIVLLRRLIRHEPLFTERDWLALSGCQKAEALRPRRWLRLLLAVGVVSLIGFSESVLLLPLGIDIFLAALGVTVGVILLTTPRIFRLSEVQESTNGNRWN